MDAGAGSGPPDSGRRSNAEKQHRATRLDAPPRAAETRARRATPGNFCCRRGGLVRLLFLGEASDSGESPTLYATDRDSYIVQGYVIPDEERAALDTAAHETVVEVYARLFAFLAEDGVAGDLVGRGQPVVGVRDSGNLLVRGTRLTDEQIRDRLAIPAHEDAVEIPKAALLALVQLPACA